ncbi:1899_t:CDS:1, partial [Paraglomus brasilianum]
STILRRYQLRIFDARNNTVSKSYTSEKQERFTLYVMGLYTTAERCNGNA